MAGSVVDFGALRHVPSAGAQDFTDSAGGAEHEGRRRMRRDERWPRHGRAWERAKGALTAMWACSAVSERGTGDSAI